MALDAACEVDQRDELLVVEAGRLAPWPGHVDAHRAGAAGVRDVLDLLGGDGPVQPRAQEHGPDVIAMGIPEDEEPATLDRLKHDPRTRHIPVVVLCELDNLDQDSRNNQIYVGMSRARNHCVIVAPPRAA